jgi:hypothetical protein
MDGTTVRQIVSTMTIKDLGRWESLEIVLRYTRAVTFEDSLRFYKAPLSYEYPIRIVCGHCLGVLASSLPMLFQLCFSQSL